MLELIITFDDGREKHVSFDGRVKMKHVRQLGDAGMNIDRQMPVLASILGLTESEADELTFDQFIDIQSAIKSTIERKVESVKVPNESAPS